MCVLNRYSPGCRGIPPLRCHQKKKLYRESSHFLVPQLSHFVSFLFLFLTASSAAVLTLNQVEDFGSLGGRGGSYVPTDKQSTAEAIIFILHQQSAFHMKGVMFNVLLRPW